MAEQPKQNASPLSGDGKAQRAIDFVRFLHEVECNSDGRQARDLSELEQRVRDAALNHLRRAFNED